MLIECISGNMQLVVILVIIIIIIVSAHSQSHSHIWNIWSKEPTPGLGRVCPVLILLTDTSGEGAADLLCSAAPPAAVTHVTDATSARQRFAFRRARFTARDENESHFRSTRTSFVGPSEWSTWRTAEGSPGTGARALFSQRRMCDFDEGQMRHQVSASGVQTL